MKRVGIVLGVLAAIVAPIALLVVLSFVSLAGVEKQNQIVMRGCRLSAPYDSSKTVAFQKCVLAHRGGGPVSIGIGTKTSIKIGSVTYSKSVVTTYR